MEKSFDLANIGRINRFYSQDEPGVSGRVTLGITNDSEARAIRGTMIQQREALRCIKREIARLVEHERKTEETLVRLGAALAPYNHNLLPNEILGRIFSLLATGYGTVKFPILENNIPPQLAVSHVCSHWRRVALCTPELWNDARLSYPKDDDPRHLIRLLQRWLCRARTFPVTLSIMFDKSLGGGKLASILQNILSPIQVKVLKLFLTYEIFMELSTLPEAALSGLSECELDITFPEDPVNIVMSDHPLIPRLRSLTFHELNLDAAASAWNHDPLHPSPPWSQLRSLKFDSYLEDAHLIIGILRQIPMLEVLQVFIQEITVPEQLTLPSLRDLAMFLETEERNGTEVDEILRSFVCPSLTKFSLFAYGDWTSETFQILKRQYNMQGLRDANIDGYFTLPVSSFLNDAPMLYSLSLGRNSIMDDEAIIGMSNGTLGQRLRKLDINITCDIEEVLSMVEARKKTVDELIKMGCTWDEEITVLNNVVLCRRYYLKGKQASLSLEKGRLILPTLPLWDIDHAQSTPHVPSPEGRGEPGSLAVCLEGAQI